MVPFEIYSPPRRPKAQGSARTVRTTPGAKDAARRLAEEAAQRRVDVYFANRWKQLARNWAEADRRAAEAKRLAAERALYPAPPPPELSGYRLTGYACLWNVDARPEPPYGICHRTKYGAFRESLASGRNIDFKLNHDRWISEACDTHSGNLRLREDGRGLRLELDLPDDEGGREVVEIVRAGKARGFSFSWSNHLSDFIEKDFHLLYLKCHLIEVSLMTAPREPAMLETGSTLKLLHRSRQWTYLPVQIRR
jgi:HK97 family phage prohead protease